METLRIGLADEIGYDSFSSVNLWYGSADKMAPIYRGHYYKNELPNSSLKVIENEGHFSLIRNHLEEILLELKPTHNITLTVEANK